MDSTTKLGLGAAAIAAVLLIMSAFSTSWLIGSNYGIKSKVGLKSVDICVDESSCETVALSTWAKSDYAPDGLSTYITLGTLSFFTSLITAGFMLVLLGYGVSKKVPHWPVHPGSIALLLSIALLIVGVLTLALHPFKTAGWGTGPGFMMLGGGDVAALIAALFLGRSVPESEDDWFE
tara:strand:- start:165201 stop:165734 length:534 start_codon:yes stop_codon:yes gene_type:complete